MLYPSCILLNQRSKRQIISSLELDTDAKAHDAMTAVGRKQPFAKGCYVWSADIGP